MSETDLSDPKKSGDDSRIEGVLHSALDSLPSAPSYLLALSGGLDSVAMLHLVSRWAQARGVRFRAIHVNHGLSPNAAQWQVHCESLCDRLNIPLTCVSVTVAETGQGLEAEARKVRYQAFAAHLAPNEVLVLAHHQDDQLETVVMRMLRSGDVNLLAGVPKTRSFASGALFRPWLHVTRFDIETWANSQGLCWVEDESNKDIRFERNRVRHHIVPALSEADKQSILKLSDKALSLSGLSHRLGLCALSTCIASGYLGQQVLKLESLARMSPMAAEHALRTWIASLEAPQPSKAILKRFYSEFVQAKAESRAVLNWQGVELRRHSVYAYLELRKSENWVMQSARLERGDWEGDYRSSDLPLAFLSGDYRIKISLAEQRPLTGDNVQVRQRQEEGVIGTTWVSEVVLSGNPDHFALRKRRPEDRINNQSIKRYWRDIGLPSWLRESFPLLVINEQIVWAGNAALPARDKARFLGREQGAEPTLRVEFSKRSAP